MTLIPDIGLSFVNFSIRIIRARTSDRVIYVPTRHARLASAICHENEALWKNNICFPRIFPGSAGILCYFKLTQLVRLILHRVTYSPLHLFIYEILHNGARLDIYSLLLTTCFCRQPGNLSACSVQGKDISIFLQYL